jgi:hypothetical protein
MKKIYFILAIFLVFLLFLFSNLFIGTGNYSNLKSILSNETKYYIKRYIFPWKLIAQHENEIDFLKDKVSVFDNEKLSKYDIAYKKSLKDIKIIKKKDKKLSHNLKLQKYKLKDGFNSGIYREYPGSGFLDFHGENFFILSARGILGFHDNIKNIENNLSIKQIKNNINNFIGLNEFLKKGWFSIKDFHIYEDKIFVSYTEEILPNCWNTSVIWAEVNYKNIIFKKLFSDKNCINQTSPKGEDFSAHQSGGEIINFDDSNILLSVGDYRRRFHAQDLQSINGKIIMININNKNHKLISMGHRNPQGIYFDKDNKYVLISEQGPQGGDEINLIEVDKINNNEVLNFGWPVVSAGEHYGGKIDKNIERYKKYPLHKSHSQYGFVEPLKSFVPSVAITTIIKIRKKNYIVASLKDKSIYNFKLNNNNEIINLERIEIFERVRDIVYKNNNLYLFLENTASIGIIDIKNL